MVVCVVCRGFTRTGRADLKPRGRRMAIVDEKATIPGITGFAPLSRPDCSQPPSGIRHRHLFIKLGSKPLRRYDSRQKHIASRHHSRHLDPAARFCPGLSAVVRPETDFAEDTKNSHALLGPPRSATGPGEHGSSSSNSNNIDRLPALPSASQSQQRDHLREIDEVRNYFGIATNSPSRN